MLLIGGITIAVYASTESSNHRIADDTAALDDTISDALQINSNARSYDKEETVYAIGDANGNIQETIVTDWLKNPNGLESIQDYTELNDIHLTKGDETYSLQENHTYIWNTAGKDIHYQGTTQKRLPVTTSVSYFLDGTAINPEELAGKSGHVTIRFDYANTQTVSTNINGQLEDIYIPFMMVSGIVLDDDTFSNVKVSTGSVFNDGSRNIVIGCAMPGLAKSLDISDNDLDLPEYVEIEADTMDFSLTGTLTVALTDLFDSIEIDPDSDIGQLTDSLQELEDAALDLVDGTSDLYTGVSTLYDSCGDLQSGTEDLLNGAKDLKDGADSAHSGSTELKNGLKKLSKNSNALDSGAKDMVDAIFSTATTQLRAELVDSGLMTETEAASITLTRDTYVSVFQTLSSATIVTPGQVEAQLRSNLSAMTESQQDLALTIAYDLMAADSSLTYADAVNQAATMMSHAATAQTACAGINPSWVSAHAALVTTVKTATGANDTTAAQIAAVALALDNANPEGQINTAVTYLSDASTVAGTTASDAKISALCTAIAGAASSTGSSKLDAVKSQLDDVMVFYKGLLSYTDGVNSAYDGSKDLAEGLSSLEDGTEELYDGVDTLYTGSNDLVSGVGELKDGSLELKDGAQKFYDDGIQELVSNLGGDTEGLIDRLRVVADAGRDYQSFAGLSKDMSGCVKFIYRTNSIDK